MPALRDLATITRQGRTGNADTVPERAWLLWTAFREATQNHPSTTPVAGGYSVIGAIKRYARDLFRLEVAWGDPDAERAFMAPIYAYLRSSGNAHVIRRNVAGDPYTSEWFLSADWNDQPVATTSRVGSTRAEQQRQSRSEARDAAERAVTAHEAGEDRAPEPVTVIRLAAPEQPAGTFMCRHPDCNGRTFTESQGYGGHIGQAHGPDPYEIALARNGDYVLTQIIARPTGNPEAPYGCPFCETEYPLGHGVGPHAVRRHGYGPWTVESMYARWPAELRPRAPWASDVDEAMEALEPALTTPSVLESSDVRAALDTIAAALSEGALAKATLAERDEHPLIMSSPSDTIVADLREALGTLPLAAFVAFAMERLATQ